MSRKYLFVPVVGGVLFCLGVILFEWWFSGEQFTLYLHCENNTLSFLDVAQEVRDGEFRAFVEIDLGVACKQGAIKFSGYQPESSLSYSVRGAGLQKIEIIAEYGRDIQRDNEGFYSVIRVINFPPYLVNDRI